MATTPTPQDNARPSGQPAQADTRNPLTEAREREARIADNLRALAAAHGVKFREPLQIDARGEFSLIVENGAFGTLAGIIANFRPRFGQEPSNFCAPSNAWCFMNHFDAERMVAEWHRSEPGPVFIGDDDAGQEEDEASDSDIAPEIEEVLQELEATGMSADFAVADHLRTVASNGEGSNETDLLRDECETMILAAAEVLKRSGGMRADIIAKLQLLPLDR